MIAYLNPRGDRPFAPGNVLHVHAPRAVSIAAPRRPLDLNAAVTRACTAWFHDGGNANARPWSDYLLEEEVEAYSRMLEGEEG